MKKSTALLVLLMLLISGGLSQAFAFGAYRPGRWRDIDANYRFKADGRGHISLCRKERDQVIFEVQGSGNSEYCVWSKYVFIRVVPLKNEEEANDDNENDAKQQPPKIRFSPEKISLPGQPYSYYILVRKTAEIIGPLTEDEFVQRDEVGKYQVRWKYIETTYREYSNGMSLLGLYIMFILFCMHVLPWLVPLIIIIFVVHRSCKEWHAKQQAAYVAHNQDCDSEETTLPS
ncbi:MAG: hypothetical protein FWC50_14100 [Planctomycetaceae bacterium]|nr:hypothetical protein [Planctomycetaceae bacterium]